MKRLVSGLFAAILIFTSVGSAFAQTSEQTTTAADRQSVNITVYNSNLGLVRETRRLNLPVGRISLRFADVTAQIRPETVHLASLLSPNAAPNSRTELSVRFAESCKVARQVCWQADHAGPASLSEQLGSF